MSEAEGCDLCGCTCVRLVPLFYPKQFEQPVLSTTWHGAQVYVCTTCVRGIKEITAAQLKEYER